MALGDRAVAVTADSPSVPRAEIEEACRLAGAIGIAHQIVKTDEFADPDYVRNDGTRCYFCKSELYNQIETLLPALKRAAPFLRSQVVHGLRLKFAPELSFQPDHALDYATKIDRLLHQPEVARDLK